MDENATESDRVPVAYDEALNLQKRFVERCISGELPDLLWLLEHPPTVTWGSSGGREHLRLATDDYAAHGIELVATERGGDVTYHEPGQLVGYPIVTLRDGPERDLHYYLRRLEAGLIEFLAGFGVKAQCVVGRTGVWLPGQPPRKIAAMGVRAKRWVTSHGFALNVENSLAGFETIVPCGIADAAVTSLRAEIGTRTPAWQELCAGLHGALERSLKRPLLLVCGGEARRLAEGPRHYR